MDENLKKSDEKKVMLIAGKEDGELKAVKSIDKNGDAKTVDPTESNAKNLLDVNTNDSFLTSSMLHPKRHFQKEQRVSFVFRLGA